MLAIMSSSCHKTCSSGQYLITWPASIRFSHYDTGHVTPNIRNSVLFHDFMKVQSARFTCSLYLL